jgi:putative ABC transport system permease protein
MSLWTRISNVFRGDREIDEELQAHILDAIEEGRDPEEARRAFGPALLQRERTRDARVIPWLDSLRADAVFGWRQLWKRKVMSAAAILSLALAIGACVSAFRLIDALLLRPLPVKAPEQLYVLSRQAVADDGKSSSYDSWAYPAFQLMRAAAKGQAELISISISERTEVTYKADAETEKAYVQYVSGWMFDSFGLRPAAGRLFTENDDMKPGAHPFAVLSRDYWSRRFGQDRSVIGRSLRLGQTVFEIVGVAEGPFTGTETGSVTDVFVPSMMHAGVTHIDWTWHRILARVKPGVEIEPLRAKLDGTSRAFEAERAKGWFSAMPKDAIERFLAQKLQMEPAAAGASGLQQNYRRALMALGVLVALVLLIACANVANLMTAQAAAREREMALRVSIGAGRARLVQLVLVESAMVAFLAAGVGAWFAWWSAPFVVSMINPPDNPARLTLPADWRVLGFGLALTFFVTLLFGLAPALRASAVRPASALKGGDNPHSRRRLMRGLIAAQVAFCFLVLFVAGLFAATFDKLSHRPTGFSAERLITLDTVATQLQPPVVWDQMAGHLRGLPGVEKVALAEWPLLSGRSWNNFISVDGATPPPVATYFLRVSPGWLDAMAISFLDGRDFRPGEAYPGAAIVNEAFARQYFDGRSPVGRSFDDVRDGGKRTHYQVVGLVRNTPYRDLREPMQPGAFVPFPVSDGKGGLRPDGYGVFFVKTSTADPNALARMLRREVARARADFRVSNVRTQQEINDAQTIRERLLAMLALFFAGVALLLAGIGLYGVLDYSVLQRRREIGIRMAIGASAGAVARLVTVDVLAMVGAGAVAGLAAGLASVRYIDTLLYQVNATGMGMLGLPLAAILAGAMLAALPAMIHAVRIDPVKALRAE